MLRVLTYHRIAEAGSAPHLNPRMISATPAAFEQQMRHLSRRYRVLDIAAVLHALEHRTPLPERAVLLTFDDAYLDFGEIAWPILRKYRLPATLFVPTGFPDHPERPFWWDRLYQAFRAAALPELELTPLGRLSLKTAKAMRQALKRTQDHVKSLPHAEAMAFVEQICRRLLPPCEMPASVLSWQQLRQLAAEGVTLGAHTVNHPVMTQITPEQAHREIIQAQADLQREIGTTLPIFCYPSGGHDEAVVALLRAAGFRLAFTTADGHNDLRVVDPLRLRRTNLTPRTTPALFRLRLKPWVSRLDAWRHRDREAKTQRQPAPATIKAPPAGIKLAYIMSRFPKISETFILYEMLEQERLGIPVEIYPLLREHQPVVHPEAVALTRRAHFQPFLSTPILQAHWHFLRSHPAVYLRTVVEALRGTWGSLNFFVGALGILPKSVRFAYEMQQQGITHIHAHFANHPALAAMIIHRLTGIPFSFTAHGSDLHKDRRMLDQKVAAAAFAVTISAFNKEVMVAACGEAARRKIHLIPCGIDPAVFHPPAAEPADKTLRLLCVASLEEVKGHRFLIEACRRLSLAGVDLVCDLVGDGPQRQAIEQQIAAGGLSDRILLHGSRPRREVAQRLQTAQVKVLASVPTKSGKREGVPVVLMEAMASGLPVVASRLSGIPELVEHGRTGLLVDPGDVDGLVQALQQLHADPELRRRLGQAGREKVLAHFNLHRNTERLAHLIAHPELWRRAE
ncbi:MAG: glycosyltransferase [candidate division KSB1 bacterium]|nr:glycosyltransferase [candidate division KSB1 bacterium]MDZ7276155.1 glycosyltransferase [candidate division KSB1 bacterium]MDZ7287065.1 glycosyltransferase [candidate division KSB1 bacterium]MDZ7297010.1 glycosyltransferase [candidate division KSB1 bacterium]MDZ7307516.1 glycosyltransferase [candidate division KSB1 bacterium]